MKLTLKRLSTPLILFIIIIETTGIDSDESLPDETPRPGARGRIIKSYSGARPEPIICTGEGFVKDPHNCAMFYRCMRSGNNKYTIFRFQCGPGTIYDPDHEVCNHPQSTMRSECGGISPPFIHTTHINDIQDNMYNEIPSPMVSSKPIHPSDTLQKTSMIDVKQTPPSYAVNSTTKLYVSSTTTSPYPWTSSINPINVDRNLHKTTVKPLGTETKISHPISRDNICKSDGFMGDSENCRKFYRCVANQRGGFTRYEFICSETTVWDEVNQSCNHVWAVKKSRCNLYGEKETDSSMQITTEKLHKPEKNTMELYIKENTKDNTVHTMQQQLQIGYGTKVTQSQTQIGNDFVEQNQTQVNYGDRLNQNRNKGSKQNQTQISHGSAISQSQIQIDYGNKGVQTQLQIDHSKEASQNQIQISETSTRKASTTIWKLENQGKHKPESTDCTEDGFIGDSNDCQKFYRCVNNGQGGFKKFGFNCADGTAWDPSIKSCNHVWAVKGCNLHGPIESTPQTITTTTYKTTQSYHTIMSTEHITSQSIEDNEYSSSYGNSKPESMQTPSSSTTITTVHDSSGPECVSNGFMGDNNDCKIFYRCVEDGNGGFTKHVFKCGEGSLWDPEIKTCNHAWAVTNCSGNISPEINKVQTTTEKTKSSTPIYIQSTPPTHLPTMSFDEHEYDVNNSPGYGPSNNAIQNTVNALETTKYTTTLTPSITTTTSTKESIPIGEKCTQSGFMGDSSDCKRFYRCVDDGNGSYIRYEFTCGEGTVWDQSLKACNHRWAVTECDSTKNTTTIVPSEGTTENSVILTTSLKYDDTPTQNVPEVLVSKNDSSYICSKEGFMADPKNCKSFYRCVNDGRGGLTKYQYSCGEGTYWNQEILSCDHITSNKICKPEHLSTTQLPYTQEEMIPEITTISRDDTHDEEPASKPMKESVSCTSEGFYGDQNNCRNYYRCVNDGKGGFTIYYFSCGEGTSWDKEIQACNYESLGRCANLTSESVQIAENPSQQEDSGTTSDKHNTSTTSQEQCELEGFFAVPNDCKKFVRCVSNNQGGFMKYEFACSEGTVWVQEMLTCYHDTGEAYCNSQIMTKPITNEHHPQTTENYAPSSSEHLPDKSNDENEKSTIKPPPNSAGVCLSEGYYPNEKDCRGFYQCVDNGKGAYTKYEHICGEGTAWDTNTQICTHIDQVPSCREAIMHDADNSQITDSSRSTTQGLTSSTTSTTMSSSPDSNSHTMDICVNEGYFGDTQDCKKFYRCVNNGKGGYTKYDFICAEGTIWDKDIPTCNHPENVANPSCNQNTTTSNSTTNTTESNEGQSEASKVPGNNMHDADNTQTTDSSGSTTQGLTSSTTSTTMSSSPDSNSHTMDICVNEGYFGDTQDCKKFYRCVNNGKGGYTKYDFICAEGTIWDKDIPTCNHPENVANPSCNQNTTTSNSTTNTTESNEGQSEASKVPGNNSINCTKAGFYPDPNNCKKFYRCVDWDGNETKFSIFHFECAEGTIWDPAVDTCNHEDSVYPPRNCSGSQSSVTEETTTTEKESTTKSSTQMTSQSLTESTTQSTTTSTTQSTTKSTTSSTSEPTNQSTTESATTESAAQTTTERSEESTTEQSGESTTDRSGEGSTEQPPESTTERLGESTTEYSGETTTEQSGETTTEQIGENTTKESVETTTEQLRESTTEKIEESTTEKIEESTTEKLGENTTDESVESTSEHSGESTTEQSTESTTIESTDKTTTDGSGTVETTTEQQGTTESGTDYSTHKPSDRDCPKTEEDQHLFVCPSSFRRHPKYCNLFYQCDEDEDSHELKIALFACPNNTIYDENKIKCVNESKAEKPCDGEISQKRRVKRKERIGNIINDPLVVSEKSYGCSSTGYFAFEKEGDCSQGFLKCTSTKSNKLRGLVYQCPESYVFWNVSKRCEPLYKVSDCKRSLVNDWSRRQEIPIERQNVDW